MIWHQILHQVDCQFLCQNRMHEHNQSCIPMRLGFGIKSVKRNFNTENWDQLTGTVSVYQDIGGYLLIWLQVHVIYVGYLSEKCRLALKLCQSEVVNMLSRDLSELQGKEVTPTWLRFRCLSVQKCGISVRITCTIFVFLASLILLLPVVKLMLYLLFCKGIINCLKLSHLFTKMGIKHLLKF